MAYPAVSMWNEPHRTPRLEQSFGSALGQLAGGLGIAAATARFGLAGLFCSLAALAVGKMFGNSLEQKTAPTPVAIKDEKLSVSKLQGAAAAVTAPTVTDGAVDMSTLAVNGLDPNQPAAPTAAEPTTEAATSFPVAERRRNISNGLA